jgi:NAD(P)-dependent dehydrogenase (short-subunit alcohol dehydrogenase family)
MLITGGNRGLGKHLVEEFNAVSISRTTGHDITKHATEIAEESLKYDIFVNNAFDGPPHELWANFGQVQVLYKVFEYWKTAGKKGWIINIGSVGEKQIKEAEPMFETYRTAKAALSYASKQSTASFKVNSVPFKTTLITLDRLDTELSRSRPTWTGNGINLKDVSNFIKYGRTLDENTCIEEVTFYCNLTFGG